MNFEQAGPKTTNASAPPEVRVRIEKGEAQKTEFFFTEPFRIGRHKRSDVQIADPTVSRTHAEVLFIGGKWWVHDLLSTNGTYVDGKKVERVPLGRETKISLGIEGPLLSLTTQEVSEAEEVPPAFTVTHYVERYFSDSEDEDAGQRTVLIRRAFQRVRKKQRKKYTSILAIVACLFLAAGIYVAFK